MKRNINLLIIIVFGTLLTACGTSSFSPSNIAMAPSTPIKQVFVLDHFDSVKPSGSFEPEYNAVGFPKDATYTMYYVERDINDQSILKPRDILPREDKQLPAGVVARELTGPQQNCDCLSFDHNKRIFYVITTEDEQGVLYTSDVHSIRTMAFMPIM